MHWVEANIFQEFLKEENVMDKIHMTIYDTDGREINPRKLFGKKVPIVKKAMVQILKYGLGDKSRYEECYKVPMDLYSKYEESCKDGSISFNEWKEKHFPEECELERLSCFTQDQKVAKCFKQVYGAARKNGIYLEWRGKVDGDGNEPDCWTVSKYGCVIAYIQLIY